MKTIMLPDQQLQMVTPENDDDLNTLIPLLTPAYKQVFGDDIWKEGWKCSVCKSKYSLNDPRCGSQQCCGKKLTEFYSDATIRNMIEDLFVKRYQLRAVLRSNDKKAVGFQWGWIDSLDNINVKLKLWPEVLARLKASLTAQGLIDARIYYWSESGVVADYRRQGLARSMYADIRNNLVPAISKKLLRTSPKSPQYRFSLNQGDQVVFCYTDNTRDRRVMDDRVLLAGIL